MQLSRRLQAVADLVTRGNRVADIGCDHAYTSIYLARQGISPHIIAMDINQGPIDRARENILKYECEDRIEARKSNGLEKLSVNEADTIIIAGMGGALTIQILTEHVTLMESVKELILQPQSELYKVRQMLSTHNFVIIKENMLCEDGKYYVMMKAVPSSMAVKPEAYLLVLKEHFYYGRLLLEEHNPILESFLNWDLGICNEILGTLADSVTEQACLRREEILGRIQLIHSGLSYFM